MILHGVPALAGRNRLKAGLRAVLSSSCLFRGSTLFLKRPWPDAMNLKISVAQKSIQS